MASGIWFYLNLKCKKKHKWTNIIKHKQTYRYRKMGGKEEEINRWGRLRATNLQLQSKWVTGMKCTVWEIKWVSA